MKPIDHYVFAMFPEVPFDREEEGAGDSYTHMVRIVEWLASLPGEEFASAIVSRVKLFAEWCESHPRSETASDDVYTIYIVGFVETLFQREKTRRLIPAIVDKESFDANADYLRSWVGAESYAQAAAHFTTQS